MINRTNKNWREIYALRGIINHLKFELQRQTSMSEEEEERIQEQIYIYEDRIRELKEA